MTKEQALKLKPGDKVIAINSCDPCYTLGKIYIVKSVEESGAFYGGAVIYTTYDDERKKINGWGCSSFDLAYPKIFNNKLNEILNEN